MAEAIVHEEEALLLPHDHVEQLLARLRRVTSERDRIQLVRNNRVARIDADIKKRTDPLNAEIDELITEIDTVAQAHKDELTGGTQTATFRFGTLEWHTDNTGSVVIDDEPAVIAMLKTLPEGGEAVEVKESVRKNVLKKKPELLKKLKGARLVYKGSFAIKVKPTGFHERFSKMPFRWSRETS